MRRVITCLLVVAMVCTLGLPEAFAAGYCHNGKGDSVCNQTGSRCIHRDAEGCYRKTCHVDTDGDGICDFAGNRGANFTDTDGDGVCDNRNGDGGVNFTDTNGDGICDNRTENRHGKGSGGGHGGGHRRGCHRT